MIHIGQKNAVFSLYKFICNKCHMYDMILLIICFLFYLLFPICDGPVWCKDSMSYVSMDISREPLYSIFLTLMNVREDAEVTGAGLMTAVVVHSLIAGFSIWYAGCMLLYDIISLRMASNGR